ncbi:hypothetical protein D3C84_584910 [compost metagenome]
MHGQAVLQAVHATGIFRDVATDRTGDLRGWVRRVIQAERRRRLGNRQIAHTRLHSRGSGGGVDVQDVVEARHHQQHAFFQGQRTPGQTGAGAAGDHRDLQFMADTQHALHLVEVTGQHHQHRCGAVGGESVAFVRFEFFALMQDFQRRHSRLQRLDQGGSVDIRQDTVDAFIVEDVHRRFTALGCFY